MRVALSLSLASVAVALRPAPVFRLSSSTGSAWLRSRSGLIAEQTCAPRTDTLLLMSVSADDNEDRSSGPFTRKSLLEGFTKTAGVLGAGTFVQKGFFAGVPYHGTPDLTGKVRHVTTLHMIILLCQQSAAQPNGKAFPTHSSFQVAKQYESVAKKLCNRTDTLRVRTDSGAYPGIIYLVQQ